MAATTANNHSKSPTTIYRKTDPPIYNQKQDTMHTITKHSVAFADWYSPETGIYKSKHKPRNLPTDPFLDVVSFIFSHKHNGISALIDSSTGFSISYQELYPLVKSMASGLHKMGVSQNDVILLLLPNSIYFPIVFLGVLYLGAIVTTMNPLCTISEIKKQAADSCVSLAFTMSEENVKKIEPLGIPVIEVPENVNLPNSSDFHKLISGNFDLPPKPVIKQEDTAAILYSSGTTGTSKGVVISHKNFISIIELLAKFEASQYKNPRWENVNLAVLPMFHMYGLSLFVTGLLTLGTTIVVMRKYDVDEVVKVIDKYKVTHFPVVPPILTAIINRAKGVHESSLQSLKQVCSAAAILTRKTIEEFVQSLPHVDLIQCYGMTECGIGTRGFNTDFFRKYSSIGLLVPNMEAKVVEWNTGSFLPPGNTGELLLRGPPVMKGYLNNEEATKSAIDKDGWYHSGDIVYFDQDGYLYICDRLKDVIKYKGFQIAPADLEAVLILHPEIVDAAVTSALDEVNGEIPVAFVVRKARSVLSQKDVINYVAKQVAPYKKIRKVVFLDSLPRSATGKILRRQLRINFSNTSKL
ncbi:4-coumarate--CoA ligase-like [Quillaja saponaria]|uniref:4-coumarate--CoA ligase n=1 Tax=Quillaja saponaria TaxID=32244 RepID=A0AAD7KQR5_QUISA|nr:4-coumarate--CoA ligase-like [Quillaja saponaria]